MNTSPEIVLDGPTSAPWKLALAHGAGAGMFTPFMEAFASGLADQGFRVARFEFPYMEGQRKTGKRRPPDREPVLRAAWLAVVEALGRERLVIGGKSMGGRIASLIADEAKVAGLVCLGYPFHPTGKPDRLRVEHLATIATPTLICQGTRDSFGGREEVAGYDLAGSIRIHWLEDGDHGFKPRKSSGRTEEQNWQEAIAAIAAFVKGLP
ncbi:MAG: alpha/beta fold hydrolase [Planctomycetes bacterium]|nr:alpha/beta fold hydrolase [Planctomycetota bacterium]